MFCCPVSKNYLYRMQNRDMDKDIYKDFSREFSVLDQLAGMTDRSFEMFVEDQSVGEGYFRSMDSKPAFTLKKFLRFEKDMNVKLKVETGTEYAGTALIITRSNCVIQGKGGSGETSGRFTLLQSADFSTKDTARFRCFIAAKQGKLNTFRFFLESLHFATQESVCGKQCVRIRFKEKIFDLIQLKARGYYAVDSLQDTSYEEFREISFAIQQALGFVSGYMPSGKIGCFNRNKGSFELRTDLRPSAETFVYPIYTNPYGISGIPKNIADAFYDKLNLLPIACFEKLVEQLHDDPAFSATLLMMLDAESVGSLLLKPSIHAVALESLSRIIANPIETRRPVASSALFKAISRKICGVIDSFRDRYEEGDAPELLKGRIADLNKAPKGKHVSNDEKLRLPFQQLGIPLSDMDLEILKYRNELLHGNILLASVQSTYDMDMLDNSLHYAGLKLYTLVSELILKRVGYKGYIINHAKIVEKTCRFETKEDYFLLI